MFDNWATNLAAGGPGSVYGSVASLNDPPGYLWILWPIGVLGHALAGLLGTSPALATGALLKIPAIAADLAIAWLVAGAAGRWFGSRAGLVAAALYLFVPVTWYDSALWGQVDAVGALVMLIAVLLLIDGRSEAALAVAVVATLIKPQDAIVLAVVAPILVRRDLLRPGSGPVPVPGRRLAAIDARLGDMITGLAHRQGVSRLVTSALAGLVVGLVILAPSTSRSSRRAASPRVPSWRRSPVSWDSSCVSAASSASSRRTPSTGGRSSARQLCRRPSEAAGTGRRTRRWSSGEQRGQDRCRDARAGRRARRGRPAASRPPSPDPARTGGPRLRLLRAPDAGPRAIPRPVLRRRGGAGLRLPGSSAAYIVTAVFNAINLHAVLAGNVELGGPAGPQGGPGGPPLPASNGGIHRHPAAVWRPGPVASRRHDRRDRPVCRHGDPIVAWLVLIVRGPDPVASDDSQPSLADLAG